MRNEDAGLDSFLLDAALDYAERGLPVFPCNGKNKAPLTRHGFKDATTDPEQIREWWHKWPRAMIGMPTGRASGIDVLDLDVKPNEYIDGRDFVPNWQKLSPLIVRTPSGGVHVWFASDGEVRNSTDAIAPGVDTRGVGGYVIVPPSCNDRARYSFIKGSTDDIDRLPPFPSDLFAKLGAKTEGQGGDQPQADAALITAALQVIPNPDLGWEDWKKFGLATWRATSGSAEGFQAWDTWSRKSQKYEADVTRREWAAMTHSPPTRIGAGTIFYHASLADPNWRIASAISHTGRLVLPHDEPVRVAEEFVNQHFRTPDDLFTLLYHRGSYYHWVGTHYAIVATKGIRSQLYAFLKDAWTMRDGVVVPFRPTQGKVNAILDALESGIYCEEEVDPPFWIEPATGEGTVEPSNLIACRNGLLDIATRELIPHTPLLFNVNSLTFDYDPNAPEPEGWLEFLRQIWPNQGDEQSEHTLQQMFGLMLTGDTSYQKIFMLIGPKRSGKGTIGRVLTALLGKDNVVSPTLKSMTGEFGLWPLINKKAAIISDARIGPQADVHALAERLLSITGEDAQNVNRKHQAFWNGRLYLLFLILANEIPRFVDASGALASRFVVLVLTESFYGREDRKLTDSLLTELPGIFNWALEGLDKLRDEGHFTLPQSSLEAIRTLEDLASPVNAFVRDWCIVSPQERYNVKGLYSAWTRWCELEGHKPGSQIVFGRNLKAAYPQIRPRGRGMERFYAGIGLNEEGEERFDWAERTSPDRRR
jgi:putative DNA primase/helicase